MKIKSLRMVTALFFLLLPTTILASTEVSTLLSTNTTWTTTNSPYIIQQGFGILPGATLTIDPGVIIKVDPAGWYTPDIQGTIIANGTPTLPVTFTSLYDDSVGGDTNGDAGAITPSIGDWSLKISGMGEFQHTTLKYTRGINVQGSLDCTFCIMRHSLAGLAAFHGTLHLTDSTLSTENALLSATEGSTVTIHQSTLTTSGGWYRTSPVLSLAGTSTLTVDHSTVNAGVFNVALSLNTGSTAQLDYTTVNGSDTSALTLQNSAHATITDSTLWSGYYTAVLYDHSSLDATTTTMNTGSSYQYALSLNGGSTHTCFNCDIGSLLAFEGSHTTIASSTLGRSFIYQSSLTLASTTLSGAGTIFGLTIQEATATIDHSLFTGFSYDLYGTVGTPLKLALASTTITASIIRNNTRGMDISGGTTVVHDTIIVGNTRDGIFADVATAVDATDNWWGSASGPTHPTNPGGTGDTVSDGVSFTPWLAEAPGERCISSTVGCYSNVLFLPGMMGSTLSNEATGREVWLPTFAGDALLNLPMNTEGTSTYDIAAGRTIDEAYGLWSLLGSGANIYKSFMRNMEDLKEQGTINDWKAVPYDWRLDYNTLLTNGKELPNGHISYTTPPATGVDPYIIKELKRLASTSKTGKVTIVAHSNGGLLTKALTDKLGPEAATLIDKIIFVAVPQLGTPKAIVGLLHGKTMGIPESFPLRFFGESEARALGQHMPLAYNLLPSEEYFHDVDDSVLDIDATTIPDWATKYGTTTHSTARLGNFLLDASRTKPLPSDMTTPEIANPTLFARAKETHDTLDHWTPPAGIPLMTIAGWGEETLSGIGYRNIATCISSWKGGCLAYSHQLTLGLKHVIDGDGTVVEPSAQWANGATSTKYWVDLKNYNFFNPIETAFGLLGKKHADILEVPALRTLITHMLTNGYSDFPTQYISTVAPQYLGDKPRLHFTLHSPLTLGFIDTLGNYTGSTATGTVFHIPGVTYERYGEVQWLSIPKDIAGQLILHGTGSGSFTLDAEEVNGNITLSTTSFEGIPSATSTIVTMNIAPTQSVSASSTLVVDADGDGIADMTLQAKENGVVVLPPPDLTPPEAIITWSTSTASLLTQGIDETSSTTVYTTATSTLITDEAGNTLRIPFLQYKEKNQHITLMFNRLVYNGSTTTIAMTTLKYKWNRNKKGEYTMFAAYIKTGSTTLEAHYRPKKNQTILMTRPVDLDDSETDDDVDTRPIKTKLSGLIIPGIMTKHAQMNVVY